MNKHDGRLRARRPKREAKLDHVQPHAFYLDKLTGRRKCGFKLCDTNRSRRREQSENENRYNKVN